MKTSKEIDAFILAELRGGGVFSIHSSWDWEADLRMAEFLDDKEAVEVIASACRSSAPTYFRLIAMNSVGHIKQKRLASLRRLVKQRLVRSMWVGMGYGGRTENGVGRVRNYILNDR